MKNMKKLASLLLALVMVFSLATTAFAAETATAYQYEIYQIFTGDISDGKLTNVQLGTNGKLPTDTTIDDALADLAEVATSASDAEKLAVIEKYADLTKNPVRITDASTSADITVDGLADGYYLVKDVADSQEGENQAYTTYVVQVVDGTLTITRKADVPEVEKKIVEGSSKVDENEASIGDTVNYEFTGNMPTNIADYDTYYYVFTDTLSKGLTLTDTNDFKVTVNGKDVTKYFYISATEDSATDGTTITIGMQDLLALEKLTDPVVGDITATTKVVVTYSATLNENAVIGGNGNTNDVELEYSNNPNDDGEGATNPPTPDPDEPVPSDPTGETPKDTVTTYTTDLIIKKVDENGAVLTGAAFKITGAGVNVVVTEGDVYVLAGQDETATYFLLKDGTYTETAPTIADDETNNSNLYVDGDDTEADYVLKHEVTIDKGNNDNVNVEAFVGEDGLITFTGLGAGTYTITETVTPAGYNSIAPFDVTIEWDDTKGFTYDGTDEVEVDGVTININEVTVVNKAGSTLPTTGGMGTTLFYVFGGILVAAAVVLLVTKKRMSTAE